MKPLNLNQNHASIFNISYAEEKCTSFPFLSHVHLVEHETCLSTATKSNFIKCLFHFSKRCSSIFKLCFLLLKFSFQFYYFNVSSKFQTAKTQQNLCKADKLLVMSYEFQSLYLYFITEHPGSSVTEQKILIEGKKKGKKDSFLKLSLKNY